MEAHHPQFAGRWSDWQPVFDAAGKADDARLFFEQNFVPCRVVDEARPAGLFTGYYEPHAAGSLVKTAQFHVPIYAKPDDLVSFDAETEARTGLRYGRLEQGRAQAYSTRQEIETGALAGHGLEIAWLQSYEDAFFIQVQGSGRILLPDRREVRLSYAGKTGLPYTSIGAVLVARGELAQDGMSMQKLRGWMAAHPQQARQLMWENKSFVFFKRIDIDDPELGAEGAQHVNLTPLRSLAVDRSIWAFGTPVWLDLLAPSGHNASLEPFRRLMIAQDTGSAIKGAARGDVYWGWGAHAELTAGHMASPGDMTVLLPNALAARLGLSP